MHEEFPLKEMNEAMVRKNPGKVLAFYPLESPT
jgi:hypothetical protein